MLEIVSFGHLNIVVDSIDQAVHFYQNLLGATPVQYFSHFKNPGFAKAAGFLESPESLDVSINFLKIPSTEIYLELMCYHHPKGSMDIKKYLPNDLGGIRHVCLRVNNIKSAFEKIKKFDGVNIINSSANYMPYQLDKVTADQFLFINKDLEKNLQLKNKFAKISSQISFFYFTDRYGVLWELEEAPDFIDDPTLHNNHLKERN